MMQGPMGTIHDMPFIENLYISCAERRALENLQKGRARTGASKCLSRTYIEEMLERMLQVNGEIGLNMFRDKARDIAAELGRMKSERQVLVGFALETNDEEANAQRKLEKKNFDFIVLNSLQNKGTCFRSDENQISIISRQGQKDYERKPKQEVASDIIDQLAELL